jgi:hypothetical protein
VILLRKGKETKVYIRRWWDKVVRRLRDGHSEDWWALEMEAGPYGVGRAKRSLVVTTDPAALPDLATWYLTTDLLAGGVS